MEKIFIFFYQTVFEQKPNFSSTNPWLWDAARSQRFSYESGDMWKIVSFGEDAGAADSRQATQNQNYVVNADSLSPVK